jgi:hypothetical protein
MWALPPPPPPAGASAAGSRAPSRCPILKLLRYRVSCQAVGFVQLWRLSENRFVEKGEFCACPHLPRRGFYSSFSLSFREGLESD